MTTYGAYNAGLPCQNPACKSHGTPHPNCQCYKWPNSIGFKAHGGEIHYCAEERAHAPDCEYFADGGIASGEEVPDDDMGDTTSLKPGDELPPDDSNELASGQEIPEEETDKTDESLGRHALAAAEGVAHGALSVGATMAQKGLNKVGVPGFTDQEIIARKEDFPKTRLATEIGGVAGSLALGYGALPAAAKGAQVLAQLTGTGSKLFQALIAGGIFQGGSEASNWLLGESDPENPVGAFLAISGASILNAATYGAASIMGSAAKGIFKVAEKGPSWLAGWASQMEGSVPKIPVYSKYFDRGVSDAIKAQKKLPEMMTKGIGVAIGGAQGYMISDILKYFTNSLFKEPTKAALKKTAPIAKWLSEGADPTKLAPMMDLFKRTEAGNKLIDIGVESIFEAGRSTITPTINKLKNDKKKKELEKYIDEGGINKDIQQMIYDYNQPITHQYQYAEGGEVTAPQSILDNPLAEIYPDQNMLLAAAKGRISNYLSSLRPLPNAPKLAFDTEPDQDHQKKMYSRALDIAIEPLTILAEIKKGTIEPEDISHFKFMFPETEALLQKKMAERILKAQIEDKKPPYQIRAGLSMFMGQPLDGTFLPANIQAAQNVFQKQKNANAQGSDQSPAKNKKGSSSLSKTSEHYMTSQQARVEARQ